MAVHNLPAQVPMTADGLMVIVALLIEALVLLFLAKQLWGVVLRRDMDTELTTHDNPAAAISVSGYILGVLIALSGVMAAPTKGLTADMLSFGLFGLVGVVILFASLFAAPLVGGIKLQRDIIENHNVSAAVVLFSTFVATGAIFNGAVRGDADGINAWITLLVFQLLGQVALAIMAHLFEFITPYDLHKEIVDGKNLAAATGYGGALIAMGLILQNAVMGDFTSWGTDLRSFALYCLPLLMLWPVRALVVNGVLLGFKNLNHEIAVDRNVGAGVIEAATYVGFALLIMNVA